MSSFQSLHRSRLGKTGESIAASYLQKKGYRIISRNFKARYGEIDVICIKDDTVIFVEVKTRIGFDFGSPLEAVTPRKLREVIKTSEYFVLLHPELPPSQRVDAIGIMLNEDGQVHSFEHVENISS